MQLLLKRNQKSGMMGKTSYSLDVRAQISQQDQAIIKKNNLGGELLVYHDKSGPSDTLAGSVFAAMKNTALTVDALINGTTFKCKDVGELLGIEDQVKQASVTLLSYIEAARHFGGEEVIEVRELADATA